LGGGAPPHSHLSLRESQEPLAERSTALSASNSPFAGMLAVNYQTVNADFSPRRFLMAGRHGDHLMASMLGAAVV
jgi:hypothetical protein